MGTKNMKRLQYGFGASLAALMTTVSFPGLTSHAYSQSWDRDGYYRDGRSSSNDSDDDDRFYRRRSYHAAPRFDRRDRSDDNVQYDPRYENDQPRPDEGAWPGDDDERHQDRHPAYRPKPSSAPYREPPEIRDRRDEAARPPQDDSSSDGVKVADGGAQPYIPPVAPPIVAFAFGYPRGSVIVDTGGRALYYVIDGARAYRYPIAVGKEGFAWTGVEKVSRIADWPDWNPPAEMRERKPELPERMSGGLRNPLGARAIYLGNTLYRIHGTNDPKSIGRAESSGCIRMLNQHAVHLGSIVSVGTEVHVVSSLSRKVAS